MTRSVRTFCRVCNALCGVVVEVEPGGDEERVVKVTGDPDHPISEGYTCSKGRALAQLHHDPRRLERPLVRRNGKLRPASWDDVLGDLAARLQDVVARHGPSAVAAYRATHWAFDCNGRAAVEQWLKHLGTTQVYSSVTLDTPNKTLVPDLVAGAPYLIPLADWDAARLLLVVGQNPVVSHGHASARPNALDAIRRLRRRGTPVVVADPRVTETTRLADLHVQLAPGSDAALLGYLVREVFHHGADAEYLGLAADARSVERLAGAVERFDLASAAARCGVAPVVLERARDLVLSARRLAYQSGTGVSMSSTPNVAEWLGWALAAVTGSLDRPGGTLFNPGVLRPQELGLTTRPRISGPPAQSRPELPHSYGELPCAVLADEIFAGNVRALVVVGGNPALTFPATGRFRAALGELDVLAVADILPTETTALATHVLAVTDQLERADLPAFSDGVFPRPFTQLGRRAVAPAGDRRPLWWVFARLARDMGLPVHPVAADGLDRPDDEAVELALLSQAAKRSRVPWESILAAEHGVVDGGAPEPGWLVPGRLPRPLDLAPAPLIEQLEQWWSEPSAQGLVLTPRRLPRQMNSTLRPADGTAARGPGPTLLLHPDDARRHEVADGQVVEVRSAWGATTAVVEASAAMRPGVVSVTHAWSSPHVNELTSDRDSIDPLTGMLRYSAVPVSISGVGAAQLTHEDPADTLPRGHQSSVW